MEQVTGPRRRTSAVTNRVFHRFVPSAYPYLSLLDAIHEHVVPRAYLEIGVRHGSSLALALPGTTAIGIDPAPVVNLPFGRRTRVVSCTSDDFFASGELGALLGGRPLDLSFIDGMHLFEFTLRDFMNIERAAHRSTTVLVHDCYPPDADSACRDRQDPDGEWCGDVWKLVVCLREWRPDLTVTVVDVAPSGLGVISGLDPTSTVLADHYDEIVEHYTSLPFPPLDGEEKSRYFEAVDPDWDAVRRLLPARPFRQSPAGLLVARRALRAAAASGRASLAHRWERRRRR